MNESYNIDCMEFMAGCRDNQFDLAVVDPPTGHGNNKEHGLGDTRTVSRAGRKKSKWAGGKWDDKPPPPEYFTELFRVSKNQIIWCGNFYNLHPSRCWLIWDKVQRINQADCEMAWTSFDSPARIFTYARGNCQGFRNPYRFHPTEKPIKIYRWILQNYAKPGWSILDTHEGSGSNKIACYDMGFDYTGCELDPDYYKAAQDRFKNHIAQKDIFSTEEYQELIYNQREIL